MKSIILIYEENNENDNYKQEKNCAKQNSSFKGYYENGQVKELEIFDDGVWTNGEKYDEKRKSDKRIS